MIHDSFPLLSMKLRTKMYQSKTSSIDAVDVIIRTANRGKEEQQMAMG
jgi:uncharacterized protein YegP (UPF0339 family)